MIPLCCDDDRSSIYIIERTGNFNANIIGSLLTESPMIKYMEGIYFLELITNISQ
jgi:hypothetical protein